MISFLAGFNEDNYDICSDYFDTILELENTEVFKQSPLMKRLVEHIHTFYDSLEKPELQEVI